MLGSPAAWSLIWVISPRVTIFREPTRNEPDPTYPLQMWLCSACGLAQLLGEPIAAEEPLGLSPKLWSPNPSTPSSASKLTGWLSGRSSVLEFASPHGGSWLGPLAERGLQPVGEQEIADLVIDSFGMMHDPDQATALAERVAGTAPGGALLLQYHSLETIVRLGQWNALRHGHFAYYSTSALVGMLEANGFRAQTAWRFDLYGGTILLAAVRESDTSVAVDGSLGSAPVGRGVRENSGSGCGPTPP